MQIYYYQMRAVLSSVMEKIENYMRGIWQEKRDGNAQVISTLPPVVILGGVKTQDDRSASLRQEIKKKSELKQEQQLSQAEYWQQQANTLRQELEQLSWKDFAENARLKVAEGKKNESYDTLEVLNEVLSNCDFSLLSHQTKEFIEKQFGINIKTLQDMIEVDPFAVKNMVRNFFNMSSPDFIQFEGKQLL